MICKDSDTIISDKYPTQFLLEMDLLWNLAVRHLGFFFNQMALTDSNKSVMGNVSALKKKKSHWKLFGTQDRATMQN